MLALSLHSTDIILIYISLSPMKEMEALRDGLIDVLSLLNAKIKDANSNRSNSNSNSNGRY